MIALLYFYSARSLLRCLTSCFPLSLHLQPTRRLKYFPFLEPFASETVQLHRIFSNGKNILKLKPQPWQCETMGPIQWRVGCNSEGGVLLFLGHWGLMSGIPGTPVQLFYCFAHSRTMLFLAVLTSAWYHGAGNTAIILFCLQLVLVGGPLFAIWCSAARWVKDRALFNITKSLC